MEVATFLVCVVRGGRGAERLRFLLCSSDASDDLALTPKMSGVDDSMPFLFSRNYAIAPLHSNVHPSIHMSTSPNGLSQQKAVFPFFYALSIAVRLSSSAQK